MPLHKQGPDSNGNIYWMLTSAEWSGAVGEALRSQGWRYCGYSASSPGWVGGILVAPTGAPCWTKVASSPVGGPSIIPIIPQDEPPPSQGPAGPVIDTTCKRCSSSKPSAAAVSAASSPQAMAAAAASAQASAGYPWWLFVLAALTLAQVVKNG